MTENYILELKNVEKTYDLPNGQKISAIRNINLKIKKGDIIVIHGPAGAGKSTLLKIISTLEQPSRGSVIFKGKETGDISQSSLIRNEMGFVLKRNNLLPYLKVLENVMLPMLNSNSEKVKNKLMRMGISDVNKYPGDLSPFDLQKVALLRALINQPSIILADEATGDLNRTDSIKFMGLIKSLKKEFTFIIATDNHYLSHFADKTIIMEDGEIKSIQYSKGS